mmetsp:Transcript_23940/g.57183  ORF Transcript_23940/g.57183 Transcript_23940/m.57183 type:complete len:207 (+) Transcript_23940:431-1051(+)
MQEEQARDVQAGPRALLPRDAAVRAQDGPLLPVAQQLHWLLQPQVLCAIRGVHGDDHRLHGGRHDPRLRQHREQHGADHAGPQGPGVPRELDLPHALPTERRPLRILHLPRLPRPLQLHHHRVPREAGLPTPARPRQPLPPGSRGQRVLRLRQQPAHLVAAREMDRRGRRAELQAQPRSEDAMILGAPPQVIIVYSSHNAIKCATH